MAATVTRQAWNGGMFGSSGPPRAVQRPGRCTTDGCGALYAGSTPPGMRRVHVAGSREPARLYCSDFCAQFGIALAELRPLPIEDGDA